MNNFSQILEEVKSIVPTPVYLRGLMLWNEEGVELNSKGPGNTLNLWVRESVEYKYPVKIKLDPEFSASCACPYKEANKYCKHIVAALLFLEHQGIHIQTSESAYPGLLLTRKKSSQSSSISIPEQAKDFSWLKKLIPAFQFGAGVEWVKFLRNSLIFQISYSSAYNDRLESVKVWADQYQLHTSCSCDTKVSTFCQHETHALRYLIDYCDISLLNQLKPEEQEKIKKEYLKQKLPNIPDEKVEDYVTLHFDGNDIIPIPYKKAEGLYNIDRISTELHKTVGLFADPQSNLNLELPAQQENIAKDLLLAYVFNFFPSKRPFHTEVIIIAGKPTKNRDKIASNLREVIDYELFSSEYSDKLLQVARLKKQALSVSKKITNTEDYAAIGSLFSISSNLFSKVTEQILYYGIELSTYPNIKKLDLIQTSVASQKAVVEFLVTEEEEFYKLDAFCFLPETDVRIPVTELEMLNAFIGIHKGQLFHLARMKDYVTLEHLKQFPVKRCQKDQFERFSKKIIDPLKKNFTIKFEMKNTQTEVITLNAKAKRVYISEFDKFVVFRPVVIYKEGYEVEVLEKNNIWEKKNGRLVEKVRDEEYEDLFLQQLRHLHPSFKNGGRQGFFYLPFDKMMEDYWFLHAFKKLRDAEVEVYGLKELKNFKYSVHQPKVSIKVESRQDWFDTTIDISYGKAKVSTEELKRAVQESRNFIKLDDGTLGMLPHEWLEKFQKLFRAGKQQKDKLGVSKLNFKLLQEFVDPAENPKVFRELEEKIIKLKSFKGIRKTKVSKQINATLRDYQKEGLNWLNFLDEFEWGGILADDMGLGKTLQVIAFLQNQKELGRKEKNLIIAPTSLLFNWKDELQKFAPGLTFMLHHGVNRSSKIKEITAYDLVITSYGTMVNDLELFQKVKFNYIVLDESQAIKNISSLRYKTVSQLKARNRLALTGTPVENSALELFAQMNFVNPGFLQSLNHFKNNYVKAIEVDDNKEVATELKEKISPFILRRTKKEVLKELPEKSEETLYCIMSDEQTRVYEAYRNKYRDYLLGKIEEEGINNAAIHVLDGLTKLRQLCNSPRLLESENLAASDSIKIKELMLHIQEKTGKHKILVFSQFVKMLELIEEELQKEGIAYEMLHGSTSAKQREKNVASFKEDEDCRVFLISLKAGGVGLNLTEADYVYIVDPWWNPAVENQAIDRCYRIGQKKNVTAYRMICKDTIEEKIFALQKQKQALADNLLDSGGGYLKQLTKEDIERLFS